MSGSSAGSGSSRRRDGLSMEMDASKSSDSVLHRLGLVKKYNMITTVDIENMLTNSSRRLDKFLPVIQELLMTEKRDWKRFQFQDTVDLVDYNPKWQVRKDAMIHEFSELFSDETVQEQKANLSSVLAWHVTVTIPEGTRMQEVLTFLTALQEDDSVSAVSYGGALKGYFGPYIPEELCKRFEGAILGEEVKLQVECHIGDVQDHDSKAVLNFCIRGLASMQVKEDNPCEYNVDHRNIGLSAEGNLTSKVPDCIAW